MAPPAQDRGRAQEAEPPEGTSSTQEAQEAQSSPSSADTPGTSGTWPPSFPHREIDGLIERLERGGGTERAEGFELLAMVAKEAQRLRATTVRLSAAKLAEADREAREILARAQAHADALRSEGLAALNDRLDEAERLLATLREAFVAEHRAVDLARWTSGRSGREHR